MSMNVRDLSNKLSMLYACSPGLGWIYSLDQEAPAYTAWRSCKQGNWMVWLISQAGVIDVPEVHRKIAKNIALEALPVWEKETRYLDKKIRNAARKYRSLKSNPDRWYESRRFWMNAGINEDVCRHAFSAAAAHHLRYGVCAETAMLEICFMTHKVAHPRKSEMDWDDPVVTSCLERVATTVRRHVRWSDVARDLEAIR